VNVPPGHREILVTWSDPCGPGDRLLGLLALSFRHPIRQINCEVHQFVQDKHSVVYDRK